MSGRSNRDADREYDRAVLRRRRDYKPAPAIAKLAQAVAQSKSPDRKAKCARCGRDVVVEGWLIDVARVQGAALPKGETAISVNELVYCDYVEGEVDGRPVTCRDMARYEREREAEQRGAADYPHWQRIRRAGGEVMQGRAPFRALLEAIDAAGPDFNARHAYELGAWKVKVRDKMPAASATTGPDLGLPFGGSK